MENSLESDDELIRAYLEGHQRAFEELYWRYRQKIMAFLAVEVGRTWAEDLMQETFSRVLTSLHRYQPRGTFSAYVYQIARNLARDRQRQKQRTVPLEQLEHLAADSNLDIELERVRVRNELKTLSVEQRQVVLMHEYLGMTFAEISNTFQRPLGTVLSQMNRAVAQLRRRMVPLTES